MIYNYNGVNIHYKFTNRGSSVVDIFLHGWGRNYKDFQDISVENESSLLIDFPPFGLSGEVEDWTVFTYSNMLICLMRHLKINKCNLIGHSFGGRIAIIVAGMEECLVNKVVLIDSAGMTPKRKFGYYYKIIKYKVKHRMGFNTKGEGSEDYKKLNDNMKKVFKSVVNTFLEENAKLIKQKTLIIFGENDKETPVYMAKKLNKLIENSKLIIMNNCGHFCFLERKIVFCEILNDFLREA